jgi:hypothetical protein
MYLIFLFLKKMFSFSINEHPVQFFIENRKRKMEMEMEMEKAKQS